MLSLDSRIELAVKLGQYMLSGDEAWQAVQQRAILANPWFTASDISTAINSIATQYLDRDKLQQWTARYPLPKHQVTVGIVMAGNIPLVGFHDLLCGFLSGHRLMLKLSSKDRVLMIHLLEKLIEWEPEIKEQITVAEVLKGCDAYIATGSNNTARYFEQYFGKYPHIIRKNRTSVAVLDGSETEDDLRRLASDIFSYYGLGCRNVSQLCVPAAYDFTTLLDIFDEHGDLMLQHKYKNNYDYYLAIYLLNKVPYLTNGSVLLTENNIPFSPVSALHYRYYTDKQELLSTLGASEDVQCIVGKDLVPFGMAQLPSLSDYADGVDTMAFLSGL
jgi:hypothetical protein